MFDEYTVVRAKRDLHEDVPEGTRGAIVVVYDKIVGDYEVEFIDQDGNHLALLTVNKRDLLVETLNDQ